MHISAILSCDDESSYLGAILKKSISFYLSEARMMMMSPKRPTVKGSCENKEFTDNDGSCFSPRRLLAFPPDGSALMLDSSAIVEENSDHDLLLNVPSNSSFPQAELLHPALSSGSHSHQASTSSSSVHHNLLHPR